MKFNKSILHGAETRKHPQSGKTRFGKTRKIMKNAVFDIARNIPNKGSVVLISITESSFIPKEANTVQNGLNKVARNSGPFFITTGPEKKENEGGIANKSATQNERKERCKMGPHPMYTRAKQKTMINGLLPRARGTGR